MPKLKYDSVNILVNNGFAYADASNLRKIALTLHRWHEHECNGAIQRDETTGLPYWYNTQSGKKVCKAPDREKGALARLNAIMARYLDMRAYVQSDPRGASLYILRPRDIIPGNADLSSYYNRGIAVY